MSTTSHQQLSCAFPCVLTATVPAGISLHQQFLCSGVLSFSFFPPLLSFSCSVDPTHFTNFISFNIAALVFDQRVSLAPPHTHTSPKGCGAIHGEEKVAQPWRFIASSRSLFHAGANEVKQETKKKKKKGRL